jgi:hypothetical protein
MPGRSAAIAWRRCRHDDAEAHVQPDCGPTAPLDMDNIGIELGCIVFTRLTSCMARSPENGIFNRHFSHRAKAARMHPKHGSNQAGRGHHPYGAKHRSAFDRQISTRLCVAAFTFSAHVIECKIALPGCPCWRTKSGKFKAAPCIFGVVINLLTAICDCAEVAKSSRPRYPL